MTQEKNMRARWRPRHFAISYTKVQGLALPRKRETRGGFHIQFSVTYPRSPDAA
jgi:hypothetical protein